MPTSKTTNSAPQQPNFIFMERNKPGTKKQQQICMSALLIAARGRAPTPPPECESGVKDRMFVGKESLVEVGSLHMPRQGEEGGVGTINICT